MFIKIGDLVINTDYVATACLRAKAVDSDGRPGVTLLYHDSSIKVFCGDEAESLRHIFTQLADRTRTKPLT